MKNDAKTVRKERITAIARLGDETSRFPGEGQLSFLRENWVTGGTSLGRRPLGQSVGDLTFIIWGACRRRGEEQKLFAAIRVEGVKGVF